MCKIKTLSNNHDPEAENILKKMEEKCQNTELTGQKIFKIMEKGINSDSKKSPIKLTDDDIDELIKNI